MPSSPLSYNHIIGTGGIGTGILFRLEGDATLGRNESRAGMLMDNKDYCKLHIILHYVSILLVAAHNPDFICYAIGKVGSDDTGGKLSRMMEDIGIEISGVTTEYDIPTTFSVCFEYPDHSGGNITDNNGASSRLTPADISSFFSNLSLPSGGEIMLAVPEVPIETRVELLRIGRKRKSFNVASFLASEVAVFKTSGHLKLVDMIALNIGEASALTGLPDGGSKEFVAKKCIEILTGENPVMRILITCGADGVMCYSNNILQHTPAISIGVKSTAGAGDAFLAGVIAGLSYGLPLIKRSDDALFGQTELKTAVEVGVLTASMAITSPHAIETEFNLRQLQGFVKEREYLLSPSFKNLLKGLALESA